jgi:hypothetical protein
MRKHSIFSLLDDFAKCWNAVFVVIFRILFICCDKFSSSINLGLVFTFFLTTRGDFEALGEDDISDMFLSHDKELEKKQFYFCKISLLISGEIFPEFRLRTLN